MKEELEIPVFHDDQHGTAIACLAGVKGALRLVKKDLATAKIVVNSAGAAGANIARLLYLQALVILPFGILWRIA